MNTPKTKGDILAERIESLVDDTDLSLRQLEDGIRDTIAEYRKPEWTLGRSVNGHTLRDGQEWHRTDWTEDMLPDGWRPLLLGEYTHVGDMLFPTSGADTWRNKWQTQSEEDVQMIPSPESYHWRTRRPLPILTPEQIAEGWVEWHGGKCPVFLDSSPTVMLRNGKIPCDDMADSWIWRHAGQDDDIIAYRPDPYEPCKKALIEGKVIQCNEGTENWKDYRNPLWRFSPDCYRVKPTVMVPLGPEDVPPMSLIRKIGEPESWHWRLISYVTGVKMVCADRGYPYPEIQHTHEISRDGGKTWQKCEKENK
jgi:hypothetical protein